MEYKKMKGQATMTGQLYEIRVAALLYLRCRNNPEISEFQLATNVEGAGALDDIVLRYKTIHNSKTWRTCFLQLKHTCKGNLSDSMLKSPSGNFSLTKYCKSFYEIKEVMMSDGDKEELFNGQFDDCLFLLYTNAKATGDLSKRTEDGSLGEIETLLKSESDRTAILGFKGDRDADLLLALGNYEDLKEFFGKIKVLSGQPTERELVKVLKCELQQSNDVSANDIGTLYRYYEKNFTEWWEEKNSIILSEKSDIYQRVVNKVTTYCIDNMSSLYKKQLCFNIQFQDMKLLENVFPLPVSLLHIVSSKLAPRLSCTKLIQFLKKDSIFFGLKYLLEEKEKVVAAWLNGKQNNLVILSESTSNCCEMGKGICKILRKNELKKIIVVSERDDKFTNSLKENLVQNYKEIEDVCQMSQLEEKSLKKIMETEVRFQGHRMILKELFNDHGQFLLDVFLDDDPIAIGQELPDVIPYYIPRFVIRPKIIPTDIFQARLKSVIAVSGATLQELQAMIPVGERVCSTNGIVDDDCRLVLLDSDETVRSFEIICETKESVHWLHKDGEVLEWRATKGPIDELKPFINKQSYHITNANETNNCFDVNQRCALLVAEPGMGKTTLMSHIVKQTKNKFPNLWVICIKLIDHIDLIEETPCDDIVEFLASALGFTETSFDKSFLKYSIQQTGNAVIVLDGLDEVLPHCDSKGFNLLTKLLETKVKKLWVTSRSSITDLLEKRLSTLSVQLQPFIKEDQITFLTKYWGNKIQSSSVPDDVLRSRVIHLLDRVSDSIQGDEIQFTGIPLQTMMLAEAFTDYAKDPREKTLPEQINLLNLFEVFVDKKFEIYKEKIHANKIRNTDELTNMRTLYEKKHLNASLVLLMSPHQLNELHSKNIIEKNKAFMKSLQSGDDKTGIVYSGINNRPTFIHRCFAEFFSAKWFAKYHHQNHLFVKKYLYSPENKVIMKLLNYILTKDSKLHRNVLNNDISSVKNILAGSGGENVNSTDLGLRTPLHLATGGDFQFVFKKTEKFFYSDLLSYQDERNIGPKPRHLLHLLLEYGADVNMVDNVIKSTPLQYAFLIKAWHAADLLLSNNAFADDLILTQDIDSDYEMWNSIVVDGLENLMKLLLDRGLCTSNKSKHDLVESSVLCGHVGLVRLLVKKSEDGISYGMEGGSLLHLAALFGQKEVLEYLLDIIERYVDKVRCREFIDKKNKYGCTALEYACKKGYDFIAILLLKSGGSLKVIERNFDSIFFCCCEKGHLNVIRFLFDCLEDKPGQIQKSISDLKSLRNDSLIVALIGGHKDVFKFLVMKGANVTEPDCFSKTTLMKVVKYGSLSGCTLLIESFGDDRDSLEMYINKPDDNGATAMHGCSWKPRIIQEFSYSTTPSYIEARTHEMAKIAQLLISRGGNIKVVDNDGNTLLHAPMVVSTSVEQVFIESFGNDSEALTKFINTPNKKGCTVMHALASPIHKEYNYTDDIVGEFHDWIASQKVDLAKLFIANGGDIKSVDIKQRTPLHYIAKYSVSVEVAEVLVASLKGDRDAVMSYINTRDASGRTARDYAQVGPKHIVWKLFGQNDIKNESVFSIQRRAVMVNWLDRIILENKYE